MATINYSYGLLVTEPQRKYLTRLMRESRIQYNRAVKTRRRLKGSLQCRKVDVVLRELLSVKKNNVGPRINAINKLAADYPKCSFSELTRLYDVRKILPPRSFKLRAEHTDIEKLIADVKPLFDEEQEAYKAWSRLPESSRGKRPKGSLYFDLLSAAGQYAGYEAKRRIDEKLFPDVKGDTISLLRFTVSGSYDAQFEDATKASPEQRKQGNRGEPRFKRRVERIGWQIQRDQQNTVLHGDQIRLGVLPEGIQQTKVQLHRPLPDGAKVKRLAVTEDGSRWYVVLAIDVADDSPAWTIVPAKPEYAVGIDPGVTTAITAAYRGPDNTFDFKSFNWKLLDEHEAEKERIEEQLARMQGPDRRTGQKASKRWLKLNRRRSDLLRHIRRQRKDIHHNLSRHLADHGFVAIGAWEPVREVKGRKDFKAGETENVEPGPMGVVRKRREGRDRAIASLRALTEEKMERAGGHFVAHAGEQYTTQTCSECGERTGPKGDTSIREWTCTSCGVVHDRDQNAAINILMRALEEHTPV